jgi:hypothetical protein
MASSPFLSYSTWSTLHRVGTTFRSHQKAHWHSQLVYNPNDCIVAALLGFPSDSWQHLLSVVCRFTTPSKWPASTVFVFITSYSILLCNTMLSVGQGMGWCCHWCKLPGCAAQQLSCCSQSVALHEPPDASACCVITAGCWS